MIPQTRISARLLNDIRKKDNKRHFVKGNLTLDNGSYNVTSLVSQSSGNLVGFSSSNCLIELEEDVFNPTKGDIVECIMI
jgi:molybdopterin biosynthesis enzyme